MAIAYDQRLWDVIVIGAGPAGATISRLLARASYDVLLIEKNEFPRDKVCGCCINSIAAGVLADMGLPGLLRDNGAVPFSQLLACEKNTQVQLALPTGYALSRSRFDEALVDAALISGVNFLSRATARVLKVKENCRVVSVQTEGRSTEVQAKLVIVADGLGGTSLSELPEFAVSVAEKSKVGAGLVLSYSESFYEEGRIYMACSKHGYVGLVRIEDQKLDVAVALNLDFMRDKASPAVASAQILESANLPIPAGFLEGHWTGTGALTRNRRSIAGERLFIVGDACGYTEPFTGEGISWALIAAVDLTGLASSAITQWRPEMTDSWQQKYKKVIGHKQKVSTRVAKCLRNDRLRQFCLRALSVVPSMAQPVVRQVASLRSKAALSARGE